MSSHGNDETVTTNFSDAPKKEMVRTDKNKRTQKEAEIMTSKGNHGHVFTYLFKSFRHNGQFSGLNYFQGLFS